MSQNTFQMTPANPEIFKNVAEKLNVLLFQKNGTIVGELVWLGELKSWHLPK